MQHQCSSSTSTTPQRCQCNTSAYQVFHCNTNANANRPVLPRSYGLRRPHSRSNGPRRRSGDPMASGYPIACGRIVVSDPMAAPRYIERHPALRPPPPADPREPMRRARPPSGRRLYIGCTRPLTATVATSRDTCGPAPTDLRAGTLPWPPGRRPSPGRSPNYARGERLLTHR